MVNIIILIFNKNTKLLYINMFIYIKQENKESKIFKYKS